MDDAELIAQVERRPAIWDPRTKENSDARQNRAAWRQLCKLQHPGFDELPPTDKREKSVALQKRWLELRKNYYRWRLRGRRRSSGRGQPQTPGPEVMYKMTFLADVLPGAESFPIDVDAVDEQTSAKRPRSDSATSLPPTPEADEDRHFLLSLVSHMQDVPRQDRLALRRDMLAVVAKYAVGSSSKNNTTPTQQAATSTSSTSKSHQQ